MRKLTEQEVQKIKLLIANLLSCDETEITPKAHIMHDLGGDSLDAVEIVMMIEEEFEIQIDDEEAEKSLTFDKLIETIENKLQ